MIKLISFYHICLFIQKAFYPLLEKSNFELSNRFGLKHPYKQMFRLYHTHSGTEVYTCNDCFEKLSCLILCLVLSYVSPTLDSLKRFFLHSKIIWSSYHKNTLILMCIMYIVYKSQFTNNFLTISFGLI